MKYFFLLLIMAFLFMACNQQADNSQDLQNRIDGLEAKTAETYKPGIGDFMRNIQTQHIKLWFAGKNENWELADFEVHELTETLEDIETHLAGREEIQFIKMIYDPLDSVDAAIDKRDSKLFEKNYTLLTKTCNDCHQVSKFGFNVIKIPEENPFTNQDFEATGSN